MEMFNFIFGCLYLQAYTYFLSSPVKLLLDHSEVNWEKKEERGMVIFLKFFWRYLKKGSAQLIKKKKLDLSV